MTNKGIELWSKAKKLIPGGNQLLSKRTEKFLPDLWPSYYEKAKGCEVWGIDGEKYYDFAQMGVGSCTLGYADEDVNAAVINAIQKSSMCTLNSYEEVELAERLIALHPWADMVRYARTGGEACAVAVRIARAASGKSRIAFCGYHGWHDWYLAANVSEASNLDDQLLPGLKPNGVPKELAETVIPFNYNKLEELEALIEKYGTTIGTIIMEPQRSEPPAPGFLEGVRHLANKLGAVLIFDEVTSAFRINNGGIHLTFDIEPDIAIFGKALGNGFPISAIIGRRAVMDHAQECFISSTFWTERIGFAAALATLKKIEQCSVPEKLIHYGKLINDGWQTLADRHHLPIKISGIPPLTHIAFQVERPLEAQTLYTQEMLEKGFLLGASVYTTFAYTDEIVDEFIKKSDEAFGSLKAALDADNVKKMLKGNVIHAGFKRLT